MRYLVHKSKKGTAAHVWTGEDTACRMFSTGGLGRHALKKHLVTGDPQGRRVCQLCVSKSTVLAPLIARACALRAMALNLKTDEGEVTRAGVESVLSVTDGFRCRRCDDLIKCEYGEDAGLGLVFEESEAEMVQPTEGTNQ